TPSVATTTGITIASMMPVALNSICRSARAMGPFGSSTPSVQPPSIEATPRTIASKPYRILGLPRAEFGQAASAASGDWRALCMYPHDATGSMRGRHAREGLTTVVDQESRKQHEQIGDGKQEQPVGGATISPKALVKLKSE